ncbi:MAG: heterodisulfide reductase-related iron-sulfur binding cluster [Bacteroidota bacterium]|nr:heterodisulfide reductase-related iron-sulfur binding cluster [Bacteroidota bacterium]MDP4230072.1 heterodisulfide reductase-related iron-sulfur binding cluster [Bacteroidota bacterium]MDP4235743.1 heterodisulfide reductase-related iron-sulfur binding cluster [Bacteroidota bacterium]
MNDNLHTAQFFERSEKLQACIHCGLCLEHCPTYLVTGEEMSSPRGRIYLMKAVEEGSISATDEMFVSHEGSCVVCRSCETACPSGVQFGILMEQTREIINERAGVSLFREFIYTKLIGSPILTRILQVPIAALAITRLARLFEKTFDRRSFPLKRFASSIALLPDQVPFPHRRNSVYRSTAAKRGSVGLLIGCIGDLFTARINDATISVLNKMGYDVHIIPEIACCGALSAHAGFGEHARELALKTISALESATIDYYIANIAGCGAMLKDYPKLFEGHPEYERATRVRGTIRDISEFLLEFHEDDLLKMNLMLPKKKTIGYQAPCHLYHGQQIKDAPAELLKLVRNTDVFAFEENEICCGSAGTHNIEHPEMGEALLERKMIIITSRTPDIVATANAGCLMQLQLGVRDRDLPIPVMHVIEVVNSAMSGSIA